MGEKILHVPLSDVQMLMILKSILEGAWADGKHFCISVVCGATGRVMSFPMEGTMLVSCDRPEARGIATKKATVLFLTREHSSKEIGEGWLTKPIKPGEEGTFIPMHRELAYLADPANITGYEGAHCKEYECPVLIRGDSAQLGQEALARWTVIIACSGDEGHVDAEYAELGFNGFEQTWQEELTLVTFNKPE